MYNGRWMMYYEDRLVSRWRSTEDRRGTTKKRVFFRGKRVGKTCPLTSEERKAYVKHGSVKTVALIRARTGLSLHESLDLLRKAQGEGRKR